MSDTERNPEPPDRVQTTEESPPPTVEDLMEVGMGTEEKGLKPDDVQYFEK